MVLKNTSLNIYTETTTYCGSWHIILEGRSVKKCHAELEVDLQ